MITNTPSQTPLFTAFKHLIEQECFATQDQLADAMLGLGYDNITQTKVSRLLGKLGAIKATNYNNTRVYKLPSTQAVPRAKQKINSIVVDVQHNEMQIVVKTITGGGIIIAKIVESMGEAYGVLGCIPSDNTILVIPSSITKIEQITQSIVHYLKVNTLTPAMPA